MKSRILFVAAMVMAFAVQKRTDASIPHSTVLHAFGGADGANPNDPLVNVAGVLYGTTPGGGAFGLGTIFSVTRDGAFTSLYSFQGVDGTHPQRLVRGPDGFLYGTTAETGAVAGTFFRVSTSGALATLYTFNRTPDGTAPGPLMLASDGSFYGWTARGGANGLGTAFRMATDGTLTMLHAFASSDPAHNPHGAFVEGTDGNLYAVSGLRVLQMTRSGAATAFGPAIAASEVSDLIAGNDGRLYAGLARVSPGPTYEAALLSMSPAGDFVFGRWQSISLLWRPSFQSPDGSVLGFRDHDFNQPPWRDVVHVSSGGEILHPNTFADTPEPPPIFYRFFKITSMIDGGDGYAYATTANDGANRSGSILRFSFGNRAPLDFTGDGKSNRVFFRPSLGQWININSGFSPKFGGPGDLPVPADYDGDGESDLAIYRPGDGSWYISPTTTAVVYRTRWGGALDRPVPGDYDGDRKADIAVFRPASGTWYVLPSTSAPFEVNWGVGSDIPVPGDYDGDGLTDIGVFRPSDRAWYIRLSAGGSLAIAWGASRDIPVPGDYDGDGITDIAVFRPADGIWYVLFRKSSTAIAVPWGADGDVPVVGDFDGDGRFDFSVYRSADNRWYDRYAAGGFGAYSFDRIIQPGDVVIANRP